VPGTVLPPFEKVTVPVGSGLRPASTTAVRVTFEPTATFWELAARVTVTG